MINFPDHFLFFYFCLYFKICKYDKDKEYFLFPCLLEKRKLRLAEVCTDPEGRIKQVNIYLNVLKTYPRKFLMMLTVLAMF